MNAQIAAQTARTPFRTSGCFVVGADDVEVCEVHQTPRRRAQEACDLAAFITNACSAHDYLVKALRLIERQAAAEGPQCELIRQYAITAIGRVLFLEARAAIQSAPHAGETR